MSDHSQSAETSEEISLDTPTGLLAFADHIDEQYENFLLLAREVDTLPGASEVIASGKQACRKLMGRIRILFDGLEEGIPVSEDGALLMQTAYDDFLEIFTKLESFLATSSPTETSTVETGEEAKRTANLHEMFPERELGEDSIVSKKILQTPRYQKIIKKHFSTAAALESFLWRLVRLVEEPSKLDKVLGVKHGSLFKEIFKGKTIGELELLSQQSGSSIRNALLEMEIEDKQQYDYRSYVAWMDELEYMRLVIPHDAETTFEELLAMFELERLADE